MLFMTKCNSIESYNYHVAVAVSNFHISYSQVIIFTRLELLRISLALSTANLSDGLIQ